MTRTWWSGKPGSLCSISAPISFILLICSGNNIIAGIEVLAFKACTCIVTFSLFIDSLIISIKASEVLRNYGVDNAFRKNWPMIYVDNDLYWIVGLRKSDLAKENEKKSKRVLIKASLIKDNLYNLNNS